MGHPRASGYVRRIVYTMRQDYYYYHYDEDNKRNKTLQDAILMYMDNQPKIIRKFKDAFFKLTDKGPQENSSTDLDSDSVSDSGYSRGDEIQKYQLQIEPPLDVWFDVEEGIQFTRTEQQTQEGDKHTKTLITFTFKSELEDGQSKINGFVDNALALYKDRMSEKKDVARYFYTPQYSFASKDEGDKKSKTIFKRYKLSEEKTFQSFFHPEKEELLRLIDHFTNKKGKFAIAGYPHKLGLLLHGPPGTGKTSLIKALAQHTRRHIISIPLARVETNQELLDLVFNQSCSVQDDDWNYKLPFGKTIFVMEDIDAACNIVQRRAKGPCSKSMAAVPVGPVPKPVEDKAESTGEGPNNEDPPFSKSDKDAFGGSYWAKRLAEKDELNLAGILNVLDGVIDCPNRILVMTTNHPEMLDPALIRPGRINKQIYLGYMRLEQALQLTEHYFGELTEAERQAFGKVFPDCKVSPAALEALCADCDTVNDMVEGIKRKFLVPDMCQENGAHCSL